MTGSNIALTSRTFAYMDVPRGLAFCACSRGSIWVRRLHLHGTDDGTGAVVQGEPPNKGAKMTNSISVLTIRPCACAPLRAQRSRMRPLDVV